MNDAIVEQNANDEETPKCYTQAKKKIIPTSGFAELAQHYQSSSSSLSLDSNHQKEKSYLEEENK